MKTLALALMLGFATWAQAYTYDGWIDPKEFSEWEKVYLGNHYGVDMFQCTCDGIEAMVGIMTIEGVRAIVLFAYYIDDVEYVFVLKDNHYKQVHPEVTPKPEGDHI
jgi:hypothetical protein